MEPAWAKSDMYAPSCHHRRTPDVTSAQARRDHISVQQNSLMTDLPKKTMSVISYYLNTAPTCKTPTPRKSSQIPSSGKENPLPEMITPEQSNRNAGFRGSFAGAFPGARQGQTMGLARIQEPRAGFRFTRATNYYSIIRLSLL